MRRCPMLLPAVALALLLPATLHAATVPLAPPTALRTTVPLGEAGVPYPATSLLHEPQGVFSEGMGEVWIAEGAGRRVQLMSANGPVAEIGAPGRVDGLGGAPVVRSIADMAVVRGPSEAAGWSGAPAPSPTWYATNTPVGSPTPSATPTTTATPRPSATITPTPDRPPTRTPPPTATATATDGPSPTARPSATPDAFREQPEAVRHVWYADAGAHVVVALRLVPGRAQPRVMGVFGAPDVPGSGDAHLRAPHGIALDERGFAYVADTGNHRVLVLDWRGRVVAELGDPAGATTDPAGFHAPERLAFDADRGWLFVADTGNQRVVAYDMADPAAPRLAYVAGTSGVAGDGAGEFDRPTGLGVYEELLLVADAGNDRIQILTAATGRHRIDLEAPGVVDVDLTEVDIVYAVPGEHRVEHLDRRVLEPPQAGWGSGGLPYPSSRDHLDRPVGVAAMPGGAWLTAERAGRVLRHTADGGVDVQRERQAGSVTVGVAARADGWSAVLDAEPARFVLFAPDGGVAAEVLLAPPAADGPLPTPTPGGSPIAMIAEQPAAIALRGQDRVLVADAATGRVRLLDLDGRPAAELDGSALAGWRFDAPRAIAVAPDGAIAVADAGRHAVERFDVLGRHVGTVGGPPGSPGRDFDQLDAPSGVAYAPDGALAVADAGSHRVQVFDAQGRYRTTLGGGDDLAPSGLRTPAGAAFDAWGVLAVADTEGHRVLRYAPADTAEWRPEVTNGYGAPDTTAVGALAEHEGALHAATREEGRGAALWRSEDGTRWERTMRGGFSDASHGAIHVLHGHQGWLYAGTESVVGRQGGRVAASRGGALWRSRDGDDWRPVTTDGFGEAASYAVSAMAAHDGALYAALAGAPEAGSGGARVLRSVSGDPGSWSSVGGPGLGAPDELRPERSVIGAMAVFSDALHAGVCPARGAPEVWRLAADDAWEPAGAFDGNGGQSAFLERRAGGDCVTALVPFEGGLYAMVGPSPLADGPRSGAPVSVWRCCEAGGPWAQVSASNFGQPGVGGAALLTAFDDPPLSYLYAAVGGRGGLQVWRSPDGEAWDPLVDDGFGDDRNREVAGPGAWARFADRLFVGTRNDAHGGELWSTGGSRPPAVPPTKPVPVTATPRPTPQPIDGPMGYERVDQWPVAALDQPPDVLGNVVDLAVDADGIAYLSDEALSRVARLAPDGTWLAPLAVQGPPQVRLGTAGPVAVDAANDRVYVGDLASDRIVVLRRDGELVAEWPNVHPADMALDDAGRLWVADRYEGGVRRFAPDGSEELRYGRFGFPRQAQGDRDVPELFAGLASIGVDADGRLWVGHRGGPVLRRYRQEPGTLVIEDSDNLARNGCGAARMAVLGRDALAVEWDPPGDPPLACVIEGGRRGRDLPTAHRSADVEQIRLRATDVGRQHAVAMAVWQPAPGMGAAVQAQARPAVLRYADTGFRALRQVDRARDLNTGALPDAERILAPARISAMADGSLMVSDEAGINDGAGGVRRFSPGGDLLEQLPVATYPDRGAQSAIEPALSVATGDPGWVIGIGTVARGPRAAPGVLYGDTIIRRRCAGGICRLLPFIDRWWSVTLPSQTYPPGLNALSVDFAPAEREFLALQLYRDNPSPIEDLPARVLRYPLDQRGRRQEIDLPWGDRLALWVDIDVGTDGRLYVLDTLNDWVQIHRVSGELVDKVRVPSDAWRIAGGPGGDLFVLTTHAEVVRLAPDGSERARFKALPRAGLPDLAPVDIAVDGDGYVYVLDGFDRRVTVFAPAGRDTAIDVGAACAFAGDKWADPLDLPLGDTTTLELLLAGSCGEVEQPADIVLAVAIYPRSRRRPDPTMTNLRVARQVVAAVDFARHRMGILVYSSIANVETELTDKAAQAVRAITSVKPASRGRGNDYVALRTAKDLFTGPPDRNKVLIVVAPFGTGNDAILDLADELKADGITILAVNGGSPTVSSELLTGITVEPFGAGTARPALRRLFRRLRPPSLVATGVVTDRLPANMAYVAGSANPPAAWDAASRTLSWDVSGWPEGPAFRASVDVRPMEEGRWPTNVEAGAELVDGWGNSADVRFPVPFVNVYGDPPPSATPRPTRTPTPTSTPVPTREPTPVPTSEPGTVYLPLALRTEGCKPETRYADAVVVLDTSGSMSAPTSPGGPLKLDAARDAARAFLEQLAEGEDQAAVVQFNGSAEVVAPLGAPSAALAALGALTQASGTRLDLALETAAAELEGPTRDPRNNAVLVLLTDGEPNGVTAVEVRAVAASVKARFGPGGGGGGSGNPGGGELLLFTIGLGTAVDEGLLRDVATKPAWYFAAPDTADLARIYGQIVTEIPCEPDWP